MHPRVLPVAAVLLLTLGLHAAPPTPIAQRFIQEIARHRDATNGLPSGPVTLVEAADGGRVRVFAAGRWQERTGTEWRERSDLTAAADGPFRFDDGRGGVGTVAIPWAGVRQLVRGKGSVWVVAESALVRWTDGSVSDADWNARPAIRQLALMPDGTAVVASAGGLFRSAAAGWERMAVVDGSGRDWAAREALGVAVDAVGALWVALPAGLARRTGEVWTVFEGRDGLPVTGFTALAAGADGSVWAATGSGVIRWDGSGFHYRQGPRWLPSDETTGLAVDASGGAWIATAGGLGWIERRPFTLAAKAAHYEEEIARYVKRTPYGYVAEAPLRTPGDRSSAAPEDSDNDGLWTAMYGAGECFAFAATGDPAAGDRARQAFEALRFLQEVTQGGSHAPDRGYVARTIRPVEWPDPNEGRLARDLEAQQGDRLWKAYEPRWPRSADGRWYWKSDTSSDELDGHYFFYPLYHDLVAGTEAEKERVQTVVRDLTDHLIAHDFALTDHDGRPTRWAVYGPGALNRDPDWWVERGLNSLSLLSYLAVASHLTGDPRYDTISRELVEKHGYAQNLMFAKVHFGPGSGNQSDDEMAFMCFYNLLRYSRDEALKEQVRYAYFAYWANEAPERNPFFHFAYAAHGLGRSITNGWGVFPVEPWDEWLEDSRSTLHGLPLDRLNWPLRNSHRLDLVFLGPQQGKDLYAPEPGRRGRRVDGRVLPVENRHFNHWNTDPWDLDYGGSGDVLGAGTVFLLPYYMGLYHGFVERP